MVNGDLEKTLLVIFALLDLQQINCIMVCSFYIIRMIIIIKYLLPICHHHLLRTYGFTAEPERTLGPPYTL